VEAFELFESVEKTASRLMPQGKAEGAAALALQKLEESYNRLWAAERTAYRRAGETLDAFVKQIQEAPSLNKARQTRMRQEKWRDAKLKTLEKLQERRGA
jgi:hypothetical protein